MGEGCSYRQRTGLARAAEPIFKYQGLPAPAMKSMADTSPNGQEREAHERSHRAAGHLFLLQRTHEQEQAGRLDGAEEHEGEVLQQESQGDEVKCDDDADPPRDPARALFQRAILNASLARCEAPGRGEPSDYGVPEPTGARLIEGVLDYRTRGALRSRGWNA